ncbi:winged helix-turn-helix domain-containing protein [Aestuariivirga sp.]|uniref:winged helix-turn-helix domain-containing protein n=1 Tax=Aestuariivirga sp. TaxID=2650926 RepID=UPI0039E4B1B8
MKYLSEDQEEGAGPPLTRNQIVVWDPVVRSFHWTIVTCCVLNLFILDEGKYWHRVTGYVVFLALIVRLFWGFCGSRHARFADFFPTPAKLAAQLKGILSGAEPRYIGHSPVRALMRRSPVSAMPVLEYSNLKMDVASRTAACSGLSLALTNSEASVLELLLRSAGTVVANQKLEHALSDFSAERSKNAIELTISRLRKKLTAKGATVAIEPIRGVGYLLRGTRP